MSGKPAKTDPKVRLEDAVNGATKALDLLVKTFETASYNQAQFNAAFGHISRALHAAAGKAQLSLQMNVGGFSLDTIDEASQAVAPIAFPLTLPAPMSAPAPVPAAGGFGTFGGFDFGSPAADDAPAGDTAAGEPFVDANGDVVEKPTERLVGMKPAKRPQRTQADEDAEDGAEMLDY